MISNTLALILNEMEEGIKVESALHKGSKFSFKIVDKSPEDQITVSSHRVPAIKFTEAKMFDKYHIDHFEMEEGSFDENSVFNLVSAREEKKSNHLSESTKKNNSTPWSSRTNSSFFFISDFYNLYKKDIVRKIEKNNGFNFVLHNLEEEKDISEKGNLRKLSKNSCISKKLTKIAQNYEKIQEISNSSQRTKQKKNNKKETQESSRIDINSLELVDQINIFEYNKEKIKSLMRKKICSCPTALIIDDNDFNILALSTQLESFNIKCCAALNGNEAMGKIIEIFGIGPNKEIREKFSERGRRSLAYLSEKKEKSISKENRSQTTKLNNKIYNLKKKMTFMEENFGHLEDLTIKEEDKSKNTNTNRTNKRCCTYFKVIFLDLEMPGKNGIETFENIKKFYKMNKLLDKLNVIAVTAHERNSEIAKRILEKGVKELVTKPISMEVLVISMENCWFC